MFDSVPPDQPPAAIAAEAPPIAVAWFATPARRVEAASTVEGLRSQLRTAHSATAVLDSWCLDHRLAPGHAIVADKLADGDGPDSAGLRRRLRVGPAEPLVYRHVRLRCRGHLLSEAELWYAPARLPDAINRRLRETNTPFGQAVATLAYRRRSIAGSPLWMADEPQLPADLFTETALLVLPDGRPLAFVREVYKSGLLDFPPP